MSNRTIIFKRVVRTLVQSRRGAQGPAGVSGSISPDSITQGGAGLGDVLSWDGNNWVPTAVAGTGTVTSVQASGGSTGLSFSGGPITGSGTLTMAGTLALASGGTGATTPAGARSALGLGDSDKPSFAGLRLSHGGSTWSLEIVGTTVDGYPITQWVKQ